MSQATECGGIIYYITDTYTFTHGYSHISFNMKKRYMNLYLFFLFWIKLCIIFTRVMHILLPHHL
jgi:hypothetical protein